MSLINDALKRARLEARRQDAESRGVEYRAVPAHSRRGGWSVGQLAGWTVAAVAIGLLLWVSMRPARQERSAATQTLPSADERLSAPASEGTRATAVEPTPAGSGLEAATGNADTSPSPPLRAEPEVAEAAAAGTVDDTEVSMTPVESAAVVGPADEASPGEVAPRETREPEAPPREVARSQGDVRLENGAVYLRRARAADGSTVELGGIAYSAERPIAVINGSVVSPGDMIAGFTLVGIEPERVELETDGVRIYLTLH